MDTSNIDIALDVMGQQPLLRIYTQICYCFGRPQGHSDDDEAIVATLTRGLEWLSADFPWVAGQVAQEPAGRDDKGDTVPGQFKIKPLGRIPRLVVRDLRQDPAAPTMAALRQAEFPMRMLDEDVIAARRTLPGGPGYSATAPEPVALFQANFVEGGLVLTVNGQHAAMDMTGQAEMVRLFNKACRGEAFTADEIATGRLARDAVVPLLEGYTTPGPELANQIVPPAPAGDAQGGTNSPASPPPPASWAYFSFSAEALRRLKAEAAGTLPPESGCSFVSTDDAVTALIWQATTRSRLPRLGPSATTTTTLLARAVDVRSVLGVPAGYPGLLQNMTYTRAAVKEVADDKMPLGEVAAWLRAALVPADLRRRTRAMVTHVAGLVRADKTSTFSLTATADAAADVMLSSWAKAGGGWDCDFGLGLGSPEAVRRPRFTPFEGLMYLLPKGPDGSLAAAISLRDDDMARLRDDQVFGQYARYIG